MTSSDYKLSPLILLQEYSGRWEDYIDIIYKAFVEDFVINKPVFRNKKLSLKKHPIVDNKEYTFYHLTHEGEDEDERTPDLRRCERIKWAKQTIENCDFWSLKVWPQKRKGKNRLCIWLELTDEPDYIVILDIRNKYILPWTAFVLQHSHEKIKKNKEYERYLKARTAQ